MRINQTLIWQVYKAIPFHVETLKRASVQKKRPVWTVLYFYQVYNAEILLVKTEKKKQKRYKNTWACKKGQEKSPGKVTITNRSPSQTPTEEETDKTKQAQIEQTYEKH